jgi:3-oxoacyl-[acyl-carrier protein] reductase
LVNNVGGLVARKTISEMDEEFFNKVIQLNLNSTFLACQATQPLMPSDSSIVNLASQASRDSSGSITYTTSKGAKMTFTRGLAKEVSPKNIRANSLCPGIIATNFHDDFTKDEIRKKVTDMTPLQRESAAEKIANTVACLASFETSFITGANIDINGGLAFS